MHEPGRLGDDSTEGTVTDTHLRQIALLHNVVVEVARRRADELPGLVEALQDDVVVTAGGSGRATLGWYAQQVWQHGGRPVHELFLNADRRGGHPGVASAEDVMVTLLHEASHVSAHATNVRDTCQAGRYHNRSFGRIAVSMGLVVTPHPRIGLTTPRLSPWAKVVYHDLLVRLEQGFTLVREPADLLDVVDAAGGAPPAASPAASPAPATRSKYTFASCCCRLPSGRAVTIRVATGSWRPATIRCAVCDADFVESLSTRRDAAWSSVPSGARESSGSTDGLGFPMCPTGKRSYADADAALRALRSIQQRHRPDRNKSVTESCAYACRACGRWHLTSTAQTKRRTGAPRSRSRR